MFYSFFVSDFGLCSLLSESEDGMIQEICGTRSYMGKRLSNI
jgi:hypothetical protein